MDTRHRITTSAKRNNIKAGSHNAAEKKAKKKYPNANDVSVAYTEI